MPRIVYEGPEGTREFEGAADDITYESGRDCWRLSLTDGGIRLVPSGRIYHYEKEEAAEEVDIADVDA